MSKHLVMVVANIKALEKTETLNVTIKVRNTLLYTSESDTDKMFDILTTDINKKAFVLINNEILINRSAYQYAEADEQENTVVNEAQANAQRYFLGLPQMIVEGFYYAL